MTYHTSNEEHPIDIVNIASLEGRVKERMEAGAFGYIRGGSEDEWTMKENTTSFNTKKIMPSVFGIELDTPIIQAPSAAQGLAHENGEADTAKGVAAAGSIFSISTYANTTIKDAADAAPGAPQFFQLYMSKDDRFNEFILNKAVEAGAKSIILTADSTLGGYREEDVINQFQFPLPMPNLAAYSEQSASGNGEGKGIAEIYAAAKQGLTPHVFKALASGADLVAIGRPVIYGLNLGGAEGVTSVFEHLNKELSITMQLAGTKTIDEVKNTKLMD